MAHNNNTHHELCYWIPHYICLMQSQPSSLPAESQYTYLNLTLRDYLLRTPQIHNNTGSWPWKQPLLPRTICNIPKRHATLTVSTQGGKHPTPSHKSGKTLINKSPHYLGSCHQQQYPVPNLQHLVHPHTRFNNLYHPTKSANPTKHNAPHCKCSQGAL